MLQAAVRGLEALKIGAGIYYRMPWGVRKLH